MSETEKPKPKVVPRQIMAISESRAQFADHDEPRILIQVPDSVSYEDLFSTIVWKNIRAKFAVTGKSLAGALLICKDDKGTYRAELQVRLDGQWGLVVEEIHKHVYKTPAVPPESQHDYKTEFLSANKGWGVIRKSDNQVIATAGDETGAKLKLEQHLRLIAA